MTIIPFENITDINPIWMKKEETKEAFCQRCGANKEDNNPRYPDLCSHCGAIQEIKEVREDDEQKARIKETTKKCPNCSVGIMEVANERNWYCPACGNTPVFEEGEP